MHAKIPVPVALLRRLLAATALLLSWPVVAAPWVDAAVFNTDVTQLTQIFPQMQKLSKPRLGPGGTRGLWYLPATVIAGYSFEPVLFLRDGKLRRIEQTWVSDAYPCLARAVFDDVVQSINARLGGNPAGEEPAQSEAPAGTAMWVVDDTDLIAYLRETNLQCSVRLVNRPRQLKNADEL